MDCGLAPSKQSPIHASPICLLSLFTSNSLHFAPDSAATQSLVAHLSATSSAFANLTTSTHVDEASAVESMLAQETRAWALIVLHSVERGNVDFTLRLNYSAIPSTYDLVGLPLWCRFLCVLCVCCVGGVCMFMYIHVGGRDQPAVLPSSASDILVGYMPLTPFPPLCLYVMYRWTGWLWGWTPSIRTTTCRGSSLYRYSINLSSPSLLQGFPQAPLSPLSTPPPS